MHGLLFYVLKLPYSSEVTPPRPRSCVLACSCSAAGGVLGSLERWEYIRITMNIRAQRFFTLGALNSYKHSWWSTKRCLVESFVIVLAQIAWLLMCMKVYYRIGAVSILLDEAIQFYAPGPRQSPEITKSGNGVEFHWNRIVASTCVPFVPNSLARLYCCGCTNGHALVHEFLCQQRPWGGNPRSMALRALRRKRLARLRLQSWPPGRKKFRMGGRSHRVGRELPWSRSWSGYWDILGI